MALYEFRIIIIIITTPGNRAATAPYSLAGRNLLKLTYLSVTVFSVSVAA